MFPVLRNRHPLLHPESCLRLILKGMNDTMGPSSLIPMMLLFGAILSLPITSDNYPIQAERVTALRSAREEMATVVADSRIAAALSSKLTPAARYGIDPSDPVRVYWERSGRREGHFPFKSIKGKQAWLVDGRGSGTHFPVHNLEPVSLRGRYKDLEDTIRGLAPCLINDQNIAICITETLDSLHPR